VSDLSLTRPVDEHTLHFGPLGLGGAMPPETSAQILRASMDALVLPDRIPADVRSQFDKLKTLFCDGLFTYESFTFADRDSYRALEVALKVRFLEHYDRQLPSPTRESWRRAPCRRSARCMSFWVGDAPTAQSS